LMAVTGCFGCHNGSEWDNDCFLLPEFWVYGMRISGHGNLFFFHSALQRVMNR
jgi:hypothetical protein